MSHKPTAAELQRQAFEEAAHLQASPEALRVDAEAPKTAYQEKATISRQLEPVRVDEWDVSSTSTTSSQDDRESYNDVMQRKELERREAVIKANIEKKQQSEAMTSALVRQLAHAKTTVESAAATNTATPPYVPSNGNGSTDWDSQGPTKKVKISSGWDATPVQVAQQTSSSSWDATPVQVAQSVNDGNTTTRRKRNRWDMTPAVSSGSSASAWGATPVQGGSTNQAARITQNLSDRNRPLTDDDLDAVLPGEAEGFIVVQPPETYIPLMTPSRKLTQTPAPLATAQDGFFMQSRDEARTLTQEEKGGEVDGVTFKSAEDHKHFGKLLYRPDDADLNPEQQKELRIMALLFRVKNGTGPQRKTALRTLVDKARYFGADALFKQILSLLLSPTIEEQERHLIVKVLDRVMFRLDELVRPHVHNILVATSHMLIDSDYYARIEGREIISNLAKAAGLASMIQQMRPDLDSQNEIVRNITARALAVVASALGIAQLLPFLKAVTKSKKSWQARHTGVKVVQQIAILVGNAVLPHLSGLIAATLHGLTDAQPDVRRMTAKAISALAEAAAPYGMETLEPTLKPLWTGAQQHSGKTLAAFLQAIGYIIPLMDEQFASFFTARVMPILIREMASPDEEMKKTVIKCVKQCVMTRGVTPAFVRDHIMDPFFKSYWIRRMALDKRNMNEVVNTTLELARKIGGVEIVERISPDLKDQNEKYRRMVMLTLDKVLSTLGAADIDGRLEQQLMDAAIFAFQEDAVEESTGLLMLNGFGVIVTSLGDRATSYMPQVASILKWRLNNKTARVRQQSADLITRVAATMAKTPQLLDDLGVVLYEYLGEEYPEVLGSIIQALKAVVSNLGVNRMNPPIGELLPRLTPILKNRQEKVAEAAIDLVGWIAEFGGDKVAAKEWMRICHELLEMLRAKKKAIRKASISTFGLIAKAIGPTEVLVTLLNNLRVQDRVSRVCTTIAIAIVAETCGPFTVLPALLNEYRVPEQNIQNGVLKSLSFMMEYVGPPVRDYAYTVGGLLEHAFTDRDPVHRQTAASVLKFLAVGTAGGGREDVILHLLNYVLPNVFEQSSHIQGLVFEAVEACRLSLGPTIMLQYMLQGLFHPARKVRDVYWKMYNTLYVGTQDALVPAYPQIDNDENNYYQRDEMLMFI